MNEFINDNEFIKIVNKLHNINTKAPGCLKLEMFDFTDIILHGAIKYEQDNWLKIDGIKSSHIDMHASMFRHLGESSAGIRQDKESKRDPLLHLVCRAIMLYTRIQRNIKHIEDK